MSNASVFTAWFDDDGTLRHPHTRLPAWDSALEPYTMQVLGWVRIREVGRQLGAVFDRYHARPKAIAALLRRLAGWPHAVSLRVHDDLRTDDARFDTGRDAATFVAEGLALSGADHPIDGRLRSAALNPALLTRADADPVFHGHLDLWRHHHGKPLKDYIQALTQTGLDRGRILIVEPLPNGHSLAARVGAGHNAWGIARASDVEGKPFCDFADRAMGAWFEGEIRRLGPVTGPRLSQCRGMVQADTGPQHWQWQRLVLPLPTLDTGKSPLLLTVSAQASRLMCAAA